VTFRVGQLAARGGVAVGYVLALVVPTLVFRGRTPAGQKAWLDWSSTNIVNLRHHPIAAMVTSAFVAEGSLVSWTLLALVGSWPSTGRWATGALSCWLPARTWWGR
jgi:hypothetical protein